MKNILLVPLVVLLSETYIIKQMRTTQSLALSKIGSQTKKNNLIFVIDDDGWNDKWIHGNEKINQFSLQNKLLYF